MIAAQHEGAKGADKTPLFAHHGGKGGPSAPSAPDDRWSIAQIRAVNAGHKPTDLHPRAVALIDAGHLEVVERTARTLVVEITSRSEPTTRRRVTAVDGRLACDCPAFVHRHRCAHVDAAALVVAPPGYRRLRPTKPTAAITTPTLHGIELDPEFSERSLPSTRPVVRAYTRGRWGV